MVNALFYCGLGMIGFNALFALLPGRMKPEIIAAPFMFFAAAVTARFLGI